MDRRIFGIETEFGMTCSGTTTRRPLGPDEIARYLFRQVVAWGRSSNAFLKNGGRLYLDVGSHPEYATAECDDLLSVLTQDKAGEIIMHDLIADAERRMSMEGVDGEIHLFKNNLDSLGNSYGCHENYLIDRDLDFTKLTDGLIPFLITRQIVVGAGRVPMSEEDGGYAFSQRAEHMWESVSSATTRSRPIINTRDEPHADSQLFRRLHIIVGDSNMSEPSTLLKVGATHLVLRMIEEGVSLSHLAIDNGMNAIRDISRDLSGRTPIDMVRGTTRTALDIQQEYLETARSFVETSGTNDPLIARVLDIWTRGLRAVEEQNPELVSHELDWAIKLTVLDHYRQRNGLSWSDPKTRRLDLAYHDLVPKDSLYRRLLDQGLIERVCTDEQVNDALTIPPQTTRARLRGEFIRRAQEARRDHTVDWMHLKLDGPTQRTIILKNPFVYSLDAVDEVLASL